MISLNQTHEELLASLKPHQAFINEKMKEVIQRLGPPSQLRDACEYALLNGGKRFRPALVLMIADALGLNKYALPAALSIEFFHAASLVADDLPCMDDDDYRRHKPSVHKKFGEATALLVSYALISSGYELMTSSAKDMNDFERGMLAVQVVSRNTGLSGATAGQYLDIYPPALNEEAIRGIIRMKTVSLFEIAFSLGWLFGGGDLELLETCQKAACHFGMAFQVADDLGDVDQDIRNGRKVNYASFLGTEKAVDLFHVELSKYYQGLIALGLEKSCLPLLGKYLENRVQGDCH